ELMDNSSMPNFAAPNTAGYHSAPAMAFDARGQSGSPTLRAWASLQASDFFSDLRRTEDAAAVAITTGAAGCARIPHAVTLPR
ncbi:MAG TPA: hypothetical protein VK760_00990, partial [Candidatus Acidoferrales bacterium]|nr:hypothetical protein [Candidatus Acidoferrales bacterium]